MGVRSRLAGLAGNEMMIGETGPAPISTTCLLPSTAKLFLCSSHLSTAAQQKSSGLACSKNAVFSDGVPGNSSPGQMTAFSDISNLLQSSHGMFVDTCSMFFFNGVQLTSLTANHRH